jgi:hypothetical protein
MICPSPAQALLRFSKSYLVQRRGTLPTFLIKRKGLIYPSRPRLFVGWHPHCPELPIYVYFVDTLTRPLRYAFRALGEPRKYDESTEDIQIELDLKNCWAADIAVKVKVPADMPVKERSQYRRNILREIYDSQAVIDANLDMLGPSRRLGTHAQEPTECSDDQKNNRIKDERDMSPEYERPPSRLNELIYADKSGGDQISQEGTRINYEVSRTYYAIALCLCQA